MLYGEGNAQPCNPAPSLLLSLCYMAVLESTVFSSRATFSKVTQTQVTYIPRIYIYSLLWPYGFYIVIQNWLQ